MTAACRRGVCSAPPVILDAVARDAVVSVAVVACMSVHAEGGIPPEAAAAAVATLAAAAAAASFAP
eukprot:CAMPEP_0119073244 /NCGR_PEP_ID=MMETSP1178-20130426/63483_1 /TAXON_ID=33656 /ORGANISM="unid sp, Strain CCMP2000" /LENGTH=65 /DNA_ID=CAMNT_0007055307 /DNA_START=360 /DNA_END=553 /DNA_ORIENTATION=+